MLLQLVLPPFAISIDACRIASSESTGIDVTVFSFGSEGCHCVRRIDHCFFEQDKQVVQVPALKALNHTTQLLAGDQVGKEAE